MVQKNDIFSNRQNILYIIMGASGSGKTTLFQYVVYQENLCCAAKKYSTRPERDPISVNTQYKIYDDVTHLSQNRMEKKCDIMYEINNNKYGVSSEEILKGLDVGSLIIILSDIRAIKMLKKKIEAGGHIVKVIYLLSKLDSVQEFNKTWEKRIFDHLSDDGKEDLVRITEDKIRKCISKYLNKRNMGSLNCISAATDLCESITSCLPDSESSKQRAEKIRLMFRQYVENIKLFDHVILNTTSLDDLYRQAKNIILHYDKLNSRLSKCKKIKGPVIFVLFASPKSGKGTLLENLNIMGTSQILITPKYANRTAKENDKRDGMVALGEALFNEKYPTDISDGRFHVINKSILWTFHGNRTKYAVDLNDIINNLNTGTAQIFVSNFGILNEVVRQANIPQQWGEVYPRFVYIYLHRIRTEDEIDKLCIDDQRKADIFQAHQNYIENIAQIDHVLINPNATTFSEDLHDQIMSLIELYQN